MVTAPEPEEIRPPVLTSVLRWASAHLPELAAGVVALIIAMSVSLGARYLELAAWVRHTLDVQTHLQEVWSHIQDIEIGQRSFILTGDERFLAPFKTGKAGIADELETVRAMVADNPDQIANFDALRPVIAERLRFAEESVLARREQGLEKARELVTRGTGLELSENIRNRLLAMRDIETDLLEARSESSHSVILMLIWFIGAAIALTLASLVAWVVNTRRAAVELYASHEALKESIAERDAAEGQVRQMQKMEAIGQLTGGLAHDFNNMLAVIISSLGLAQRRLAAGETDIGRFLSGAVEGAQRASNLVRRLMAFARVQPLEPEPIDANKLVSGMSELIARSLGSNIEVETVLGGGLWLTRVDPSQLENSILNLCVNARDAMEDGGRVTLETANCHLDDGYARLHPGVPAGQYVLVAVTDAGSGMPSEIVAKAFDPFFTTKEAGKGTGLGLSQVYGFVKQSGGHVKIYSEPDQGTTVKIYLPRHYPKAGELQHEKGGDLAEVRGNETVLVVDDEASVLELTAASLEELGYAVLRAATSKQALDHIDQGHPFDLLLTDIVMPGMNGRKLADHAIAKRRGLKVLFMTGFTRNAIVHNGVLDPGVHFIAKPFTIPELSRKVREALDTVVTG